MDFIPAKCPNCGGELMLPKSKDDAICTYCGSKFLLEDAMPKAPTPSVENWLKLADNSLKSGNSKESYEYYNRVLEVDSNNVAAWLGKGKSAGWLSTLGNPRIVEMLNCFSKALEYSANNQQVEIKKEIVSALGDILAAFYKLATDSFIEYKQLDNTWGEFVAYSRTALLGVDYALDLDPQNAIVSVVGAHAATNLINGVEYRDHSNVFHSKNLPEQEKQQLSIKRQKYVDILKALDPTLEVPALKKKPDCFIATATMGDYDHPYVISLRLFRDGTLLSNWVGRKFVTLYYQTSPYFANIIAKSQILRKISLWLLIKPSAKFADRINKSMEN
jgi:DNA-directed RNA polymerase subunit RPC12/RpoP